MTDTNSFSGICFECGTKHSKHPATDGETSTMHIGRCYCCGEVKAVTAERDFGYPEYKYNADYLKLIQGEPDLTIRTDGREVFRVPVHGPAQRVDTPVCDTELSYNADYLKNNSFTFYGPSKEVGRLSVEDGVMTFTGDVDESAEVMFETICSQYNNELAAARRKLEAIGALVDDVEASGMDIDAEKVQTILDA